MQRGTKIQIVSSVLMGMGIMTVTAYVQHAIIMSIQDQVMMMQSQVDAYPIPRLIVAKEKQLYLRVELVILVGGLATADVRQMGRAMSVRRVSTKINSLNTFAKTVENACTERDARILAYVYARLGGRVLTVTRRHHLPHHLSLLPVPQGMNW